MAIDDDLAFVSCCDFILKFIIYTLIGSRFLFMRLTNNYYYNELLLGVFLINKLVEIS